MLSVLEPRAKGPEDRRQRRILIFPWIRSRSQVPSRYVFPTEPTTFPGMPQPEGKLPID